MRFLMIAMLAAVAVGCTNSQYQTIQTGPDKFVLTGPDPNKLQGNAFEACRGADKEYTNYSVIDSNRNVMAVRCEKETKSFFTRAAVGAEEGWNALEKKVNEWHKQVKDSKE